MKEIKMFLLFFLFQSFSFNVFADELYQPPPKVIPLRISPITVNSMDEAKIMLNELDRISATGGHRMTIERLRIYARFPLSIILRPKLETIVVNSYGQIINDTPPLNLLLRAELYTRGGKLRIVYDKTLKQIIEFEGDFPLKPDENVTDAFKYLLRITGQDDKYGQIQLQKTVALKGRAESRWYQQVINGVPIWDTGYVVISDSRRITYVRGKTRSLPDNIEFSISYITAKHKTVLRYNEKTGGSFTPLQLLRTYSERYVIDTTHFQFPNITQPPIDVYYVSGHDNFITIISGTSGQIIAEGFLNDFNANVRIEPSYDGKCESGAYLHEIIRFNNSIATINIGGLTYRDYFDIISVHNSIYRTLTYAEDFLGFWGISNKKGEYVQFQYHLANLASECPYMGAHLEPGSTEFGDEILKFGYITHNPPKDIRTRCTETVSLGQVPPRTPPPSPVGPMSVFDVIAHEYGHAITNVRVGSRAFVIFQEGGALSEGLADFFSAVITNNTSNNARKWDFLMGKGLLPLDEDIGIRDIRNPDLRCDPIHASDIKPGLLGII